MGISKMLQNLKLYPVNKEKVIKFDLGGCIITNLIRRPINPLQGLWDRWQRIKFEKKWHLQEKKHWEVYMQVQNPFFNISSYINKLF